MYSYSNVQYIILHYGVLSDVNIQKRTFHSEFSMCGEKEKNGGDERGVN